MFFNCLSIKHQLEISSGSNNFVLLCKPVRCFIMNSLYCVMTHFNTLLNDTFLKLGPNWKYLQIKK